MEYPSHNIHHVTLKYRLHSVFSIVCGSPYFFLNSLTLETGLWWAGGYSCCLEKEWMVSKSRSVQTSTWLPTFSIVRIGPKIFRGRFDVIMKKRRKPRRIRGSSKPAGPVFRWKSGCGKLLESNLVKEDVLQDSRGFCAFHSETCTQFINFRISNFKFGLWQRFYNF